MRQLEWSLILWVQGILERTFITEVLRVIPSTDACLGVLIFRSFDKVKKTCLHIFQENHTHFVKTIEFSLKLYKIFKLHSGGFISTTHTMWSGSLACTPKFVNGFLDKNPFLFSCCTGTKMVRFYEAISQVLRNRQLAKIISDTKEKWTGAQIWTAWIRSLFGFFMSLLWIIALEPLFWILALLRPNVKSGFWPSVLKEISPLTCSKRWETLV